MEKVFYPIASVLVRSTTFLNKHFAKKNHNISVDELSHALELTDKAEISEENNILEGIIRFGGETVKEVMTSRWICRSGYPYPFQGGDAVYH